jgi:hypothetical protein
MMHVPTIKHDKRIKARRKNASLEIAVRKFVRRMHTPSCKHAAKILASNVRSNRGGACCFWPVAGGRMLTRQGFSSGHLSIPSDEITEPAMKINWMVAIPFHTCVGGGQSICHRIATDRPTDPTVGRTRQQSHMTCRDHRSSFWQVDALRPARGGGVVRACSDPPRAAMLKSRSSLSRLALLPEMLIGQGIFERSVLLASLWCKYRALLR